MRESLKAKALAPKVAYFDIKEEIAPESDGEIAE